MSRFTRTRARGGAGAMMTIRPFIIRHPFLTALFALVVVGAGLVAWSPWRSAPVAPVPPLCGRGLLQYGSPYVCVGLDQDSTPMQAADPLADLERRISTDDARVTGAFATIVLLEDMTPNASDNVALHQLRNGIEGAITAVEQANTGAGGGPTPKIKLLLANFGTFAAAGAQAEAAIENAPSAQHVVAVVGIGQSLDSTRSVIENLSAHGITTVGSDVTADNLNVSASGQVIQNFFRVAAPNTDEAHAAAQYVRQHLPHQRILLVQDVNTNDIYAQTLATAFKTQLTPQYTETFQSPDASLAGTSRQEYMMQQFAGEHSDICADQPDLIYFAGRGVDLAAFVEALDNGGECPLGQISIMTGDDGDSLVGEKLPSGPFNLQLLYTALATGNQWPTPTAGSSGDLLADEYTNYQTFATAFATDAFAAADLTDGEAIMMHDALLAETTAIRHDYPIAITNPSTVAAAMLQLRCTNTLPGASGFIAFNDATHNPVDKSMVVMQLSSNGTAAQQALEWPDGNQVDYFTSTC